MVRTLDPPESHARRLLYLVGHAIVVTVAFRRAHAPLKERSASATPKSVAGRPTEKKKADELWAVEWLAERLKPSRQRNLTPSQRNQMTDQLRWWCDRTLDVELTGQRESTRKRSDR